MLEKIKEIIADELDVDIADITMETKIVEDLGGDSLDLFEMVMKMEEEFEVEISTEDMQKIKTVGDIVNYIEKIK